MDVDGKTLMPGLSDAHWEGMSRLTASPKKGY
jgi:hypothetical protein